jgi:CheY-like chemotaxis protein
MSDERKPIVLIVDDDPVVRRIATQQLKNLNVDIFTATNGQEAVQAFLERQIDLVLMDVEMPILNGFDATRQIRSAESGNEFNVPIIAVASNADLATCFASGMNDCFSKPADYASIVQFWLADLRSQDD